MVVEGVRVLASLYRGVRGVQLLPKWIGRHLVPAAGEAIMVKRLCMLCNVTAKLVLPTTQHVVTVTGPSTHNW